MYRDARSVAERAAARREHTPSVARAGCDRREAGDAARLLRRLRPRGADAVPRTVGVEQLVLKRYALGVAALMAVGAIALLAQVPSAIEDLRCDGQVKGTAANHPGSDCGYHLTPSPTEFRFSIDDGSQRLLYLSGGTASGPEAIRLTREGQVLVERPTAVLRADRNIDVCRNQPPRDARWWSAAIDDEIAAALRAGTDTYGLEGLITGQWRPIRLHDSGCKWHGHA